MPRIDAHQHFWKFDPVKDAWIDDSMKIIQRDFLPEDLGPLLKANDMDGCVVVQADQSKAENAFHLSLASHSFIKGIVGWVDLQAEDIEEQLAYYSQFKKIKGFRHVLQGEKQRDFMLRPAFKRGIAALRPYDFTYDILIFPDQLGYTKQFIEAFPDQPFVIDHLAKPYIRDRRLDEWANDIRTIATYKNVYCKVSGMVTEADWTNWRQEDFKPYLDVVVEAFGVQRLMFGSDWPVCLVAASYKKVLNLVSTYFSSFSVAEQNDLFGDNAARFYKL